MSKRYPPEGREKAVRLVLGRLDEFESPYAAARAIGPLVEMHCETLRVWAKKALAQGTPPGGKGGAGLSAAEREELARLRKEVRDLKQANEILKSGLGFFRVNVMLLGPSGVRSFFRCPSVATLVACHDVRPRWVRPVGFVA